MLMNCVASMIKAGTTFRRRVKGLFVLAAHPELRDSCAVSSHLTHEERLALFRLAFNANHIIEIGSYTGASACCFGAALKKKGQGQVVCIDTWQNDAMTEGQRDTWADFLKNTARFHEYILPVRGFSTEVVGEVGEHSLCADLLFIDGDHSYEGVKRDWDCYKAFLSPGSVVVFHDWGWADGVQRIIEEDVKPVIRAFDSLPNLWWGVIQ